MKRIKQLIFALHLGLFVLVGSGCSAVGFGIGALSDSYKSENLEISSEQAPSLQRNSHIQILLKNGQQREGQFLLYIAKKIGDAHLENIVWLDKANNCQVSTQIAEIDRIVTKHGTGSTVTFSTHNFCTRERFFVAQIFSQAKASQIGAELYSASIEVKNYRITQAHLA